MQAEDPVSSGTIELSPAYILAAADIKVGDELLTPSGIVADIKSSLIVL